MRLTIDGFLAKWTDPDTGQFPSRQLAITAATFREFATDLADTFLFGATSPVADIIELTHTAALAAVAGSTLQPNGVQYRITNRPGSGQPVRLWSLGTNSFNAFALEEIDESPNLFTPGSYKLGPDEFATLPGAPTWGSLTGPITAQLDLIVRMAQLLVAPIFGNPANQEPGLQRTAVGFYTAYQDTIYQLGFKWQNADDSPAAVLQISTDGGTTWQDVAMASSLTAAVATINANLSTITTAQTALQSAVDDHEDRITAAESQISTKADLVAGKVPSSQLPAAAIGERFSASSEAAMLALTAQIGDLCYRSDQGRLYWCVNAPASTLSSWLGVVTGSTGTESVNGMSGVVLLDDSNINAQDPTTGGTVRTLRQVLTNLYAALTGHTHSNATTSAAGFMSAADKTKLDSQSGTNTGDQDLSGYQLLTGYHSKIASGTVALGTGSRSTTIGTGLAFQAGQRLRISSTSSTNYVEGVIDSYNSGTGALSFTSDEFSGSGSLGAGASVTPAWWSDAKVLAALLTGLGSGSNAAIAATDSLLSALAKLQAQITAGSTTYGRRLAMQNGTRSSTAVITEESVHRYAISANRLAAPVQVQVFLRMRLSGSSTKTLRIRVGNNSDFTLNSTVLSLGTTTNPSMKIVLEMAWSSNTDMVTDAAANVGYGANTGSIQTFSTNVDLTQTLYIDVTTQKGTAGDTFEMLGFRVVGW